MLSETFGTDKPIIGVIHLLPLPGSAAWDGQVEPIFLRAEQEATALATGGAHGIIIENFFDAPFTKGRVDTATACALALAARRVRIICDLPLGINALRNDALSAMAVASTVGAQFIRVNVYTGAMLTDQGIIEGVAHELLAYRRHLNAAKKVQIFADIMVKHSHPLSTKVTIKQMAKDAVLRGKADAIIISGEETGSSPQRKDLEDARSVLPHTPILVGSGANRSNIKGLLDLADGVIVASSLKRQGILENPVDVERVRALVQAASN